MDTLNYILKRFSIRLQPDSGHRQNYQSMPLEISLSRQGLAELFNQIFGETEYFSGAEIGVEQGEYSEVLAKACPTAHLYLVDAWKAYKGYRDHVSQSKLDGFLEGVKTRMARFGDRINIWHEFSLDAAKHCENESLDFVYVDSNHELPYVIADLAAWVPKVRKGGIVSGHDYFTSNGPYHVPYALEGYTKAYNISPWFVCRGDHTASWFWVKS